MIIRSHEMFPVKFYVWITTSIQQSNWLTSHRSENGITIGLMKTLEKQLTTFIYQTYIQQQ